MSVKDKGCIDKLTTLLQRVLSDVFDGILILLCMFTFLCLIVWLSVTHPYVVIVACICGVGYLLGNLVRMCKEKW